MRIFIRPVYLVPLLMLASFSLGGASGSGLVHGNWRCREFNRLGGFKSSANCNRDRPGLMDLDGKREWGREGKHKGQGQGQPHKVFFEQKDVKFGDV